jgi:hypothetical protein
MKAKHPCKYYTDQDKIGRDSKQRLKNQKASESETAVQVKQQHLEGRQRSVRYSVGQRKKTFLSFYKANNKE